LRSPAQTSGAFFMLQNRLPRPRATTPIGFPLILTLHSPQDSP